LGINVKKPEHAGSKKGGGHWGKKSEAKAGSKKIRRTISKRLVVESQKVAD
jgi:hypothetical protein